MLCLSIVVWSIIIPQYIYSFYCWWSFGLFPIFCSMHNAPMNILIPAFQYTRVHVSVGCVPHHRGRICPTLVGDTSFPKCWTTFCSHQHPWELQLPLVLTNTWCWRSSSFLPFWRVCDSHQRQVGLSIFACAGYACARPFAEEATQVFSYLLTEILCIFWTQTLWSFVCIADIFSHSAACLSTNLMVSFNKQEFLISMWSNLSTFSYG